MGTNALTLHAEIHFRQSQFRGAKYAGRELGDRRQLRLQSGEARRSDLVGAHQQLVSRSDCWPR